MSGIKRCRDCRHAAPVGTNVGQVMWLCLHPDEASVVDGSAKDCKLARVYGTGFCGPRGELFEEGTHPHRAERRKMAQELRQDHARDVAAWRVGLANETARGADSHYLSLYADRGPKLPNMDLCTLEL